MLRAANICMCAAYACVLAMWAGTISQFVWDIGMGAGLLAGGIGCLFLMAALALVQLHFRRERRKL